ncbi:MAG: hypothetical protein RRA35_14485, partial [Desulfomonilia bacterium]|nr:hypothetical protein [Desulfomonilia bacterium]
FKPCSGRNPQAVHIDVLDVAAAVRFSHGKTGNIELFSQESSISERSSLINLCSFTSRESDSMAFLLFSFPEPPW